MHFKKGYSGQVDCFNQMISMEAIAIFNFIYILLSILHLYI